MNIREINKPMTAASLNESLAKRFGKKINLEAFTLEQLEDARNRVRTTLSQYETNESFDAVHDEKYQKNKLFLDVLNAAVLEADVNEGEVPAALKAYQDKKAGKKPADKKAGKKPADKKPKDGKMPMDDNGTPGDKSDDKPAFLKKKNESVIKEGTVKAVCKECGDTFGKPTTDCKNDCNDPTQDCWVKESDYMKESKHIDEGKSIINNYFNTLLEGEEDKAEIVMAAKDMVDRLTGWMEDTAEMQSESMLELADAIRDEMGAQQSEAFTNTVKPGLESLYTAMEGTRVALTQGVGMLTGEEQAMGAMGDEPAMEPDMDMEPTIDADEPAMDDDGMGAAAPAAGGEDEAGRAKRESIQRSRRLGTILSSRN